MDSVITTLDPGMENYLRKYWYRELINLSTELMSQVNKKEHTPPN